MAKTTLNLPCQYIFRTISTLSTSLGLKRSPTKEHFSLSRNLAVKRKFGYFIKEPGSITETTLNLPCQYIFLTISTLNTSLDCIGSLKRGHFCSLMKFGCKKNIYGVVRRAISFKHRENNQSSFPIHMPNCFHTHLKSWIHRSSKEGALLHSQM